jgi:predicted N-acyltransferase
VPLRWGGAAPAPKPIAASLFICDAGSIYGRYWGSVQYVPLLHFECCYYQAIEYAIARKIQTFEGGAQGEHKLFRGLLPVEALSAHWLAHPKFARAIETFLEREGAGVTQYVNELVEHSPFKETT